MPFGAKLRGDSVRFRLWAPAQSAMRLCLEGETGTQVLPMARQDDGWFECITGAARAGTRYRFQLDDDTLVPDPVSRFQPDGVHGPSEVIDPGQYIWETPDWRGRAWREAVLYELHVGAFAGDYDGVQRKLDHLCELGVTALELMPLASFDGRRNWGYDGVLPFAPASVYGRPESLKRLIDAAHARGLMMLLDVVYNHFGPSGNYLGRYAPQFFTDRHHTPWGQAIDFARVQVREYFIHNALYWLEEYRFDGLRFDAVDQIRDDSKWNILEEIARTARRQSSDRHIHLILENDNNAAHLLERQSGAPRFYSAQWNDDLHHATHVLATAEHAGYYVDYAEQPAAAMARALAEGFAYQGEHSNYRDRHRGSNSKRLPSTAFVDFLQNHDQIGNRAFGERLAELADAKAVECLTAMLLLAPSIPLLFMGEEWGSTRPFLFFCDYEGELADAVRDGRRRELAKFDAFADPQTRERIPDPNAPDTFAASTLDWKTTESEPGARRMAFIRELLAIRRREVTPRLSETMRSGSFELADDHALRVSWRLGDGAILCIVANLSPTPATGLDWSLPGKRLYAKPDSLPNDAVAEMPPWSLAWNLE
jgi:malto-oligosyltrehalose trehalohydrolase